MGRVSMSTTAEQRNLLEKGGMVEIERGAVRRLAQHRVPI